MKWGLFSHELLFPTAAFGALTLLIVPLDKAGMIVTAILTALFYCMLRLVHDFVEKKAGSKFPLWQLSLAVGLAAIVLTVRGGGVPGTAPARDRLPGRRSNPQRRLCRQRLGQDPDPARGRSDAGPRAGPEQSEGGAPEKSSFAFHRAPSLLDRASHALLGTNLDFSCIPPECRWGDNTRFGPSSAF